MIQRQFLQNSTKGKRILVGIAAGATLALPLAACGSTSDSSSSDTKVKIAKTVVNSAYLFTLNGTTLKPVQSSGSTAILEGTKVFISPVAAALLNSTFKTKAVTKELLVGIAKITVNTTSGD